MQKLQQALTTLFLSLLLFSTSTFAQEGGFVEADAHEHGAALITLAIEGNDLTLDFISPSFNIVGFEYAPKTDEEKAAVNIALLNLSDTAQLMSFNNRANCSLVSNNIMNEMSESEEHDERHDEHHDKDHKDEEHHDEKHSDEHADEHHDEEHSDEHTEEHHEGEEHHKGEEHDEHSDEQHDEHGHEEGESNAHSEFHASYQFSCKNINRLAEINFSGLFEQYPNVEDLDVQYVTDDMQGALELNPSQTVLKF